MALEHKKPWRYFIEFVTMTVWFENTTALGKYFQTYPAKKTEVVSFGAKRMSDAKFQEIRGNNGNE